MAQPIASNANVRDYLLEVYSLKPGVVAEILAEDDQKWRELARGIEYRSHASYVGDRIAEHAGLVGHYSEERYQAYEDRHDEDDD